MALKLRQKVNRCKQQLTNPAVGDEPNEIMRWQRLKDRHKELHQMIILAELAACTQQ